MNKRSILFVLSLMFIACTAHAAAGRSVVAIVKVDKDIPSAVVKALSLAGDLSSKINASDRVVIKVSIDEPRAKGSGYVTSAEVVRELVQICKQKKARRVTVVEGVTGGDTYRAFELAGYVSMAKQEGALLKSLDDGIFWSSWVPDGSGYKKYRNSAEILNCEVFINVPVLKYDKTSSVSLSLKNLVGIIYGKSLKRTLLKGDNLDEAIVDLNSIRSSDFIVIDGTSVILEDGKTRKDLGVIIVSSDPVAADAVGAKILGFDPKKIRYLQIAESKGLGNADMKNIEIVGERIERFQKLLKD